MTESLERKVEEIRQLLYLATKKGTVTHPWTGYYDILFKAGYITKKIPEPFDGAIIGENSFDIDLTDKGRIFVEGVLREYEGRASPINLEWIYEIQQLIYLSNCAEVIYEGRGFKEEFKISEALARKGYAITEKITEGPKELKVKITEKGKNFIQVIEAKNKTDPIDFDFKHKRLNKLIRTYKILLTSGNPSQIDCSEELEFLRRRRLVEYDDSNCLRRSHEHTVSSTEEGISFLEECIRIYEGEQNGL
jgi:predicted transcriptional regulator